MSTTIGNGHGVQSCPNNHYFNVCKYGDTCPVCGDKIESNLTQEQLESILLLDESEWVCGFIVCIVGINKGRYYRIIMGKNYIGRNSDMDIVIRVTLA